MEAHNERVAVKAAIDAGMQATYRQMRKHMEPRLFQAFKAREVDDFNDLAEPSLTGAEPMKPTDFDSTALQDRIKQHHRLGMEDGGWTG